MYQHCAYSREIILRQRLVIEEYGAEIMYIKGENNVVVDVLSCLPISKSRTEDEEIFRNRRVVEGTVAFPLDFQKIKEIQDNAATLKELAKDKITKGSYKKTLFQEAELWTKEGKSTFPKSEDQS